MRLDVFALTPAPDRLRHFWSSSKYGRDGDWSLVNNIDKILKGTNAGPSILYVTLRIVGL